MGKKDTNSTEAERRMWHEDARANTRIEGHFPTPEFQADCEAVIRGTMTLDELRARSLARALAEDKAAAEKAAAQKLAVDAP